MKRFPMLNTLLQLTIALTIGLLEKILVLIYLCLPMGIFMLLMSLRSKTHKTTAISTFTNENSEFQHIFPNYILVIVEPKLLKYKVDKVKKMFNKFFRDYWGALLALAIFVLLSLLLFLVCIIH